MPTPPRPAPKRARPESPSTTAPRPAPYNRRLASALTKPFKSPLKSVSKPQDASSPLVKTAPQDRTPARHAAAAVPPRRSTPAEIIRRRNLRGDIAMLEQALRVLGVDVPPEREPAQGNLETRRHGEDSELDAHAHSEQDAHPSQHHHQQVTPSALVNPPGIAHLAALTDRWTQAARNAADALLEDVAGHVRDMGGLSAWRRREAERSGDVRNGDGQGLRSATSRADGDANGRSGDIMAGSDAQVDAALSRMGVSRLERKEVLRMREDVLRTDARAESAGAGCGDGAEEKSAGATHRAHGGAEQSVEDDDDDELTMGAMLRILHVDPRMLGWDEKTQAWRDDGLKRDT